MCKVEHNFHSFSSPSIYFPNFSSFKLQGFGIHFTSIAIVEEPQREKWRRHLTGRGFFFNIWNPALLLLLLDLLRFLYVSIPILYFLCLWFLYLRSRVLLRFFKLGSSCFASLLLHFAIECCLCVWTCFCLGTDRLRYVLLEKVLQIHTIGLLLLATILSL